MLHDRTETQSDIEVSQRSDDIAEFQRNLVEHIPALRRYARGLARDPDAADDLVHDCALKAIEKHHLWRRGTNLKAWLFTILHNLFVNQHRRKTARPVHVPYEDHEYRILSNASQSDHVELRQLEATLHNLPYEQREVILLVSMQGMSYEEAAEIIGIPLGTVRSRLSRGRDALRAVWQDERVEPREAKRRRGSS